MEPIVTTTSGSLPLELAEGTRPSARSKLESEPFRLFFPLGILFGWLGVSHWILYATGVSSSYSGTTHANLQLEGFEIAFAAGFLFTAVPRRTAGPPASSFTLALTALGLVLTAIANLEGRPAFATWGYILAIATMVVFALRRFIGARDLASRRPPASFVLVPIGFASGIAGAIITTDIFSPPLWVLSIGFDLIRQGVFFSLILGIGGLVLPLVLGYPPPADVTAKSAPRIAALALLGLAIAGTFIVQHAFEWDWVITVRGLLVLAGLLMQAGIHRAPRLPGLQRWIALIATWCVPLGPIFAGLLPDYRIALLHITFVAGFAMLTLAVGSHVVLSHTDREELRDRTRWPVLVYAFMMILAAATRVSADLMPDSYFHHLAYASTVWIAGTFAWIYLVLKREPSRLRSPPPARRSPASCGSAIPRASSRSGPPPSARS
jgi:uncharacterized protein involved in response to NO